MRSRRRHAAAAAAALPDAIELVIVGVRAGLSPTNAFEAAAQFTSGPLRAPLDEVVHRVHRGQRLADALAALPDSIGPSASSFVDAFATADRYGLAIEPVLDRLATDVRTERRRIAERHARTLPVKLSFPLVVCTLPSFVLLAIAPALLGALSSLSDAVP